MSTLQLSEVTRRFGEVVAMNRVDLELDGGVTAVVGPNAAGKSTLMKVITGHVRPTGGVVKAFGEPVWDNPNVMRRVGYVPEQDAFYEFMTGIDFVAALGELQGIPASEARKRAEDELMALGLSEGLDRPIKTYSKGMRQRVKLAQALVHQPELLLLDEPLLGCDPVARRRIQDRVRSLRNEGSTIVISSHILPEIERVTKDIAIMAGGRIVATGDISTIRASLGRIPSRIRVHTEAPRVVATGVARWDDVETIHVSEHAVDVETKSMRSILEKLQSGAPAAWKIMGVEAVDADLDSLFAYLSGGAA